MRKKYHKTITELERPTIMKMDVSVNYRRKEAPAISQKVIHSAS